MVALGTLKWLSCADQCAEATWIIILVMFSKLLLLGEWMKQNSVGYLKVSFIHYVIVKVVFSM